MTKIAKILLVGIFLFSGLIKLNDPIGTQLKLEEYFEVFSVDFAFMAGFWQFWIPDFLFSLFQQGNGLWMLWRNDQINSLDVLRKRYILTRSDGYFTDCKETGRQKNGQMGRSNSRCLHRPWDILLS